MLASLMVNLFPVEKATLPPTMGHYIHAAFLDIVRQVDRDIAERLHTDQSCKPFTISPLQGKFDKQGKGRICIRAGTECWVRFTILSDDLLSAVSRFFLEDRASSIRLGDSIFQITRVTVSGNGANGHWGASTTFDEILDRSSPFDKLNIRFYSPTAFKVHNGTDRGSENHVLPDPVHCFRSWLTKWNAFCPINIDESSLLELIQQHIRFSRYSIKTRIMNFGGYKQLGFVGDCEYQFANGNARSEWDSTDRRTYDLLRYADALASFAFYCGTGYKTTMGMGQTRRERETS